MSEQKTIFTITDKFSQSTTLLNKIEPKRSFPIASRILTQLKEKTKEAFNEAEQAHLCEMLSFSQEDLTLLFDFLAYLFEQAAYHQLNAEKFQAQLQLAGINAAIAQSLSLVWKDQQASFVTELVQRSLGVPEFLQSVDYRLQIALASDSLSKTKDLNSVLSLVLGSMDGEGQRQKRTVSLEFDKEGLTTLYRNLEKIQVQLDALSGSDKL